MENDSTLQSVLSAAFPIPKKKKYYYGDKYRRHKTGRGPKPKTKKIEELAEGVINAQIDTESEVSTAIGVPFKEKVSGVPHRKPVVEEAPKPLVITLGTDRSNPIIIQRNEHEITTQLNNTFGPADGSYVVLGESAFTSITDPQRRKYKVVFVEDINGFKYTLWFDISKLSYLR